MFSDLFSDLISPTADFEHQLGACINAMGQDHAIGQILVFERMSGTLHMRHIASADLVDTDVDDYEMVVVDFHAKLTHHFHRILTHPGS